MVASYLADLQSEVIVAHPSLRSMHYGDDGLTAHDRHVGRPFLVSYQKLDPARDALALALLARAACLAPGAPIPVDLLLASAELAAEDAAGQMALGRLVDLGFVTLVDAGVLMHRFVQLLLGTVVDQAAAIYPVATTVTHRARGYQNNESWDAVPMVGLLPHLHWLIDHFPAEDATLIALLHEASNAAWYAEADAVAEPLCTRALVLSEAHLGMQHLLTATSLHNLAWLHDHREQYANARALCERAQVITETALGPLHPMTATSLTYLAWMCNATRDHATARALEERALAIREAVLPPIHVHIAQSLHNLGMSDWTHGHTAAAYARLMQSVAIYTQIFGPEHATTLHSQSMIEHLSAQIHDSGIAHEKELKAMPLR